MESLVFECLAETLPKLEKAAQHEAERVRVAQKEAETKSQKVTNRKAAPAEE